MKRKYIGYLHQSPFYLSDNVTLQTTELAELKWMRPAYPLETSCMLIVDLQAAGVVWMDSMGRVLGELYRGSQPKATVLSRNW